MQAKTQPAHSEALPPLAYSVNDFCRAVGIGRTLTYSLISKGEIRTIRIAGRRLIPASEAQRLVNQSAA